MHNAAIAKHMVYWQLAIIIYTVKLWGDQFRTFFKLEFHPSFVMTALIFSVVTNWLSLVEPNLVALPLYRNNTYYMTSQ